MRVGHCAAEQTKCTITFYICINHSSSRLQESEWAPKVMHRCRQMKQVNTPNCTDSGHQQVPVKATSKYRQHTFMPAHDVTPSKHLMSS